MSDKHEYVVPYTAYKDGKIISGGIPTFKSTSPESAHKAFLRWFRGSHYNWREIEISIREPYLSKDEVERQQAAELATLRQKVDTLTVFAELWRRFLIADRNGESQRAADIADESAALLASLRDNDGDTP